MSVKPLAHTKLLVVDDERVCRDSVIIFLEAAGASVAAVSSAEEAVTLMDAGPYDAVISDIRMNGMDGIDLLKLIRHRNIDIPVILMTGFASMQTAISALKLGADDYLIKPINKQDVIVRAVRNAINSYNLRCQNALLRIQLQESELSFRTVFDQAADMMFAFTLSEDMQPSTIIRTNLASVSTLKLSETTLAGMTILELIAPSHQKYAASQLSSFSENNPVVCETLLLDSDGCRIPAELKCHMLRSPTRKLVIAIARITADRIEEEERFADMIEEERSAIGRELHDVICQDLASIEIMAGAAASDASEADLAVIRTTAASALISTRNLSQGFLPSFENAGDLIHAVEDFTSRQKRVYGTSFTVNICPDIKIHGPKALLHVFRIIQEAVNNSIRHGRAGEVAIVMRCDADICTLTVSDNGVDGDIPLAKPKGMGLLIMNQRAKFLGASLTITKNRPNGTTVECCWERGEHQDA